MERPVNLRNDVWQFLLKGFEAIEAGQLKHRLNKLGYQISSVGSRSDILEKISEEPAAFLCSIGLLDYPNLMKDMILGIIPDKASGVELEYIVTDSAVRDLKQGKEHIILDRFAGPKNDLAITKKALAENLARNCIIDYLEVHGDQGGRGKKK